jgi:hypothetical protein
MITIEVKFENEADKESFITSVVESFNSTGKEKSVHANTVERVGDTLFFTRQLSEVESPVADAGLLEDADLSEPSVDSSPAPSGDDFPQNDGAEEASRDGITLTGADLTE